MFSNNKNVKWIVNGNFSVKYENRSDNIQCSCQFESRNNDKIKDIRIGIYTNGESCLYVSFFSTSNVNNFLKLFHPLKDKFKHNTHTISLTSNNDLDIATFLKALMKFDINVKVISPVILKCFNIDITQNIEFTQKYEGEFKGLEGNKFDITVSDSMKEFIKLNLFTMIAANKGSSEPVALDEINLSKFYSKFTK